MTIEVARPGPRRVDVCNGDADGLCAVVQWRLQHPMPATLVTGLKRDIELLERVNAAAGDEVLVCDLSLRRNRPEVMRLLRQGAKILYFDHHACDGLPEHPRFEAHIDEGSTVCTSLLMDRDLSGAFRAWALVGAYGDNLTEVADQLAAQSDFDRDARSRLRRLGEVINYNAYSASEADVHIAPRKLYAILSRYRDPLALIDREPIVRELDSLRTQDLRQAVGIPPLLENADGSVLILPNAPWSRRVVGTLANDLAAAKPERAHAVLVLGPDGYNVSVRAPLSAPSGADALCRSFGGSGRAAAAGIDRLAADERDRFVGEFIRVRWRAPPPPPLFGGQDECVMRWRQV